MKHPSIAAFAFIRTVALRSSTANRRSLKARALLALVVMFAWFGVAQAQSSSNVQHTENRTDQALRGNLRVDPSTLGMSLSIPLATYPGRAGNNVPVTLNYNSKLWRIDYEYTVVGNAGTYTWTKARYAESSTAGWTSSLEIPWIEYTGSYQFYDTSGNSVCDFCEPDSQSWPYYVKRIHVHLPDGSAHELQNATNTVAPWEAPLDFTGIFKAVNGSRIYFDTSNNTLYLTDGSRYLFSTTQSVSIHGKLGQPATTYIDRNGNTLSYDISNRRWTDTLGRTLDNPIPNQAPVGGTEQTYNLPGFGGGQLTYKLRWANLGDVLRTVEPLKYSGDRKCQAQPVQHLTGSLFETQDYSTYLCAELSGGVPAFFNPVVLKEIELPNNQRYQFKYNIYGEIEQVLLPTGGYERYQYAAFEPLSGPAAPYGQSNRGVSDRWISVDGVNEISHTHYAVVTSNPYTVRTTAPDGSYSERVLIKGSTPNYQYPFGFEPVNTGMASEQRSFSASGQMLRRSLTEWNGTIVTKEVSILLDTGGDALAATTTYQHDADLNVISTNRYDFASVSANTAQTAAIGAIPTGSLVRTEEATYLVNDSDLDANTRAAYRARNLLGLPTSTRVKNSDGSIIAKSSISYDEAAYPLLTYGGTITGWIDPVTNLRGLPTTTGVWLNTTSSYLQTHAQYDQLGNVRDTWDANDNHSQVEYSSTYAYAYPTLTRTPVPDPTGQYGSNTALVSTTVYDFNTGRVTSTVDANNVTTTFEYNNNLNRLSRTVRASGTAIQNQTSVSYDDANLTVTTTSDRDSYNDNLLKSQTVYDGLGRTIETRQYEGGTNYIATQQQYDSMGRVFKTSNPFRPWQSESAVWTTAGFDALGRVISVTTPDSAVVNTSYSGSTVTVTDQAGKRRKSVTDGLGRLKEVYEDPNGLNYLTDYSYDSLDNLTTVSQGVQTRSFVYDSLKRLTSASNPESGTVNYSYDSNGNLLIKTDARGIVSSYSYDALNRNITITYTNDPANTPAVTRIHDVATYGKGRLYQTLNSNATTTINNYDSLGRPLSLTQTNGFSVQRTYDLAGHVTSETYPSGHVANYSYEASGRLNDDGGNAAFRGNLGDGVSRTYTSTLAYDAAGRMIKEQLGTNIPLFNKLAYNSRGQLAEMRVSTSYTGATDLSWNRGMIINEYSAQCSGASCNGTDNNGNLLKQEIHIPNNDQNTSSTSRYQQYGYDSLNRLTQVHEYTGTTALDWQQAYTYDRWGNRKLNNQNTWGWGINNTTAAVEQNTITNRMYAPDDPNHTLIDYDAAGNQTKDSFTGTGQRTYDAENRMIAAQNNEGGWTYYYYDGDGQRVRSNTSNLAQTWRVYGMDGELVAEYAMISGRRSVSFNLTGEYGYRNGQLLVKATVGTTLTSSVQNSGFETPVLDTGSYQYSFTGTAGIAANGSTLTSGNPDAPEGNQVAFLQGGNSSVISTDIGGLSPGATYAVTFSAAQRANCCGSGGEDFQVSIADYNTVMGSAQLGTFRPGGTDYQDYSATFTSPNGANLRLSFVGLNSSGGDNTALIDNVRITIIDNVEWLVTDQLGTPRMIFDKTGSLANVKRHDYLPFGEELFAGTGGRTTGQGYSASDGVRQKFTSKERDNETGLDYFLARYYASTQGRFTGADPYDINIERQNTSDPEEADNLFRDYIFQPQHWNRYAYSLNNPLRYVDPDGLREYEPVELLGKKIKIKISDNLKSEDGKTKLKGDDLTKAQDKIKQNIDNAIAKINSGQTQLSSEQITAINSMKGIEVRTDIPYPGMNGSTFQMTQRYSETDDPETLPAAFIHDSFHADQNRRGVPSSGREAEKQASAFTVPILEKLGMSNRIIEAYRKDAKEGHGAWGQKTRPPRKKTP